jgi:hypothetical protein
MSFTTKSCSYYRLDGAIYSRVGAVQFCIYQTDRRTWVPISDITLIHKLLGEGSRFKISIGDAEKAIQTLNSHIYTEQAPGQNNTSQKIKKEFSHRYDP